MLIDNLCARVMHFQVLFIYKEDVSKTNQEGLQSRRKKPREVVQYANESHTGKVHCEIVQVVQLQVSKWSTTWSFLFAAIGQV